MKYNVTIIETLERTIQVDADSEEAAESVVKQLYRDCEIVLSADDYTSTEFLIEESS